MSYITHRASNEAWGAFAINPYPHRFTNTSILVIFPPALNNSCTRKTRIWLQWNSLQTPNLLFFASLLSISRLRLSLGINLLYIKPFASILLNYRLDIFSCPPKYSYPRCALTTDTPIAYAYGRWFQSFVAHACSIDMGCILLLLLSSTTWRYLKWLLKTSV